MPLRRPFDDAATTIVIGAGADFAAPQQEGQRLILVEPDPLLVAHLQSRHKGAAQVTVLPVAIASGEGRQDLYRFSLARLNGIRAPGRLTELMPGVRRVPGVQVEGITVAGLLRRLGLQATPVHLVIDAPGSEMDILQGWKAAGALGLIDSLELHASPLPLYEGGEELAALTGWLRAEGFAVTGRDLADPDWPVLWLLPEVALQARSRQAAAVTAVETAVAEARRTGAESGARLEAATAAQKAAAQRIEALERDLGLQMRLQAMLQLDLEDQRRRLAESEARRREAEELLRKLTPHLQVAAEELHRMQLTAPSAQEPPPAVVSGAKPRRRGKNG